MLEEPLDVGPLAAKLALLPHFPGLDPPGVVQLHALRIERRRFLQSASVAVVQLDVSASGVDVELGVVVGGLVGRSERQIIIVATVLALRLLLLLPLWLLLQQRRWRLLRQLRRVEVVDVKLDGSERIGDLEAGQADVEVAAQSGHRNVAPVLIPEGDQVTSHVLHRRDGEPLGAEEALVTFLEDKSR